MDEHAAPPAAEDAAWATLNTPLDPAALLGFCRDIERLFRINPLLEFSRWEARGADTYQFSGRNLSRDPPLEFDLELHVQELADGLQIRYFQGLKTATTLRVEPAPQGSKLTITDRYDGLGEDERKARIGEVDKSLLTWATDLQKYLMSWKRWSRFAPWRWYMRRVWQPMKPTGRRITYMLVWITLFEIALILLGAAIYWIEYR